MGRPKNPKREQAIKLWKKSKGTAILKDIADELDVSASTIRKWKSQDKWEGGTKRSAPKNIKERSEKLRHNQNATGNDGGAPKHNKNAVTHGLFANWLPEETLDIIESMDDKSPADLVWDQITIQYAAIMRAQKIMYVSDQKDLSKEVSGYTDGDVGSGETYALQYAWDKQANFMSAQSRAMSVLSNLIKQYTAMGDADKDRKSKLAIMQANVKQAKAEADIAQHKADALKKGNETQENLLGKMFDEVKNAVSDKETDKDES